MCGALMELFGNTVGVRVVGLRPHPDREGGGSAGFT